VWPSLSRYVIFEKAPSLISSTSLCLGSQSSTELEFLSGLVRYSHSNPPWVTTFLGHSPGIGRTTGDPANPLCKTDGRSKKSLPKNSRLRLAWVDRSKGSEMEGAARGHELAEVTRVINLHGLLTLIVGRGAMGASSVFEFLKPRVRLRAL